jgi:hypothetical protein
MTPLRAARLVAGLAALAAVAVITAPTIAAGQRGGAGLRRPGPRQARPASQPRPVGGTLEVGDMAADFTLEPRGGGDAVTLSSFRGKSPVALVFGSYT